MWCLQHMQRFLIQPSSPSSAARDEKSLAEVERELIPVDEFLKQLKKKKKRGMLQVEFKGLSRLQMDSSCERALLPENKMKNAYTDVLPYDHCRVVLERLPNDPHSDYINASYIDSFEKPKTYIAAQGPSRYTMNDFWRMVWQEKSYCIVMATNIFEHARQQCEKYWHNEHGRYGDIEVWLESTDMRADFNIRTFHVRKDGCDEERVICQFQYASWSAHDVPNPTALLEYRRKIRAFLRLNPGPVIVHCGAGASRTGAFIAIDAALERVAIEKNTDIFDYALYLRSCRQNMVKTVAQYEFIYDCVAMYLQCGVTVITAREMPFMVQRLGLKEHNSRMTGFEREFKTLQAVVPKLTVGECAGGHRSENRWKSRDIMLQPPERARPYLITHDSNESTDYINAVYVDGYSHVNAYIVTQWPLRSTVNDIWRLIYDYNIPTVALLNDVSFSRSYPRFWPQTLNTVVTYGPLTIELIEESFDTHITSRVFRVRKVEVRQTLVSLQSMSSGTQEPARLVKIFQLCSWPNNHTIPEQADSLLELLTKVEDWQVKRCHSRIPTLVISKNGVSRCGIFCGISIAWDRLKSEEEVDIFKVVKTVKHNRPQLICSLVEYIYCYTFMVIVVEVLKATRPDLVRGVNKLGGDVWELHEEPLLRLQSKKKGAKKFKYWYANGSFKYSNETPTNLESNILITSTQRPMCFPIMLNASHGAEFEGRGGGGGGGSSCGPMASNSVVSPASSHQRHQHQHQQPQRNLCQHPTCLKQIMLSDLPRAPLRYMPRLNQKTGAPLEANVNHTQNQNQNQNPTNNIEDQELPIFTIVTR